MPQKKHTRTISGVTPIAVMTRPMACPGQCIYCPNYPATPRSYTPESPAVFRARSCDYDTAAQVKLRLNVLSDMGHPTDKVELIIMGGTFLATPVAYQYQFIKECYDALNEIPSVTLGDAKRINETATRRCTGLCIETRPDWCGPAEIKRMLEFGTTRVELGVQTLDEEIYHLVRRGHTVADVADATARLRDHGLKVYYHWMPGLPGSSPEKDYLMTETLFNDGQFRPDGLKIYPTAVVEDTELEQWYREGRYQPYTPEMMIELMVRMKSMVPEYVRIARVLRDIPSKFITAGPKDTLRNVVLQRMAKQRLVCRCIRCREYGHRLRSKREIGAPILNRLDYNASGGKEVFLSFKDETETLFGLLRLRIQPRPIPVLEQSQTPAAVIRELHVFGPEVRLCEQQENAAQHKGLGKALLTEAERIAREEFHLKQVVVLSGVGAKEYYRAEGYRDQGEYMEKNLP